MQPPRRSKAARLSDSVARRVGELIVAGQYQPGDLLDGEVKGSERYDVSRGTYREAIRILAAKGLVEPRRHTGTRIKPVECWHWLDPDVLRWISGPRERRLIHAVELRRLIEPNVAALAAVRRTSEQLAQMKRALRAPHLPDRNHATTPLVEFRRALFRSSNNKYLEALGYTIENVVAAVCPDPANAPQPRVLRQRSEAVFVAIQARNASEASKAMFRLIAECEHGL